MDDIKLALLGDKAAQERLTERGELLPCAHCKGNGKVSFKDYRFIGKNFKGDRKIVYRVQIICNKCRSRGKPIFTEPLINPNPYITKWGNCYADTDVCNAETNKFSGYVKAAISEWNTRAPILTPRDLEERKRLLGKAMAEGEEKARNQAIEYSFRCIYAAVLLAAQEVYGFGHKRA